MKQILAALCITLTLGIFPAFAAPPATITYQGYLTNNSGTAISGNVAMIISLYDAAGNATNTPLWSESQPTVQVANGVYTVQLGSITPLNLPFDTTYYLGVAVGGESEMTPRLTLTSAPTVFRAMSADKLNQPCGNGQVLMYASASSSWGCITPGALATKDTIADADVAANAGIATSKLSGAVTAITNHGLGSAATLNAGTAAGNLVQLDGSTKLPAVDGSLLTNLALSSDASSNTKGGTSALASPTGGDNTAFGSYALSVNTSGGTNVAVGTYALSSNTTGSDNTALGYAALTLNTTATNNVAIGNWALHEQSYSNSGTTYSAYNVAVGGNSLAYSNPTSISTGIANTALGYNSLLQNSTGAYNIGIGYNAGSLLDSGNYNIAIGNTGVPAESNSLRIGTPYSAGTGQNKAFIAGIYNAGTLTSPQTVVIDENGQLSSVASSAGTVTSVDISGGTTGLTTSGGPVTGSGTITLAGTLAVANGGTGAIDAASARTNFGLGTAATLNVGTGNGNLVQLDATTGKLPTVDGSLLTNTRLSDASSNTVLGTSALANNTTGHQNTAYGNASLFNNTSGHSNTAYGNSSLYLNTTGATNTALGVLAMSGNTTGSDNIALGMWAGSSLTTGNYNIDIGNTGVAAEGNTIRIGTAGNQTKTFIAGISGVTLDGASQTVVINANGQLGSVAASGGSGTVTQVTASAPLSVTNGTTTPTITLGTVPVTNGGTGTTDGSITGTGALTFTAGSTNANINLTPSGTGTVNVASKRITNLATPTGNTDATTKAYVDSKVGVDARFGTNTSLAADGSGADCSLGSVWLVAGVVAGGMPCNGTSLDKTVYAALFSLLGYTYGGSGNNFNLPDLRTAAPNGLTYVICVNGLYPMRN